MGAGHSSVSPRHRQRSHTTATCGTSRLGPRLSCPEYMTHYDVKEMMRKQDVNRNHQDLPNLNSENVTANNNSVDPLEALHNQFNANRTVEAKMSVRSNISDISIDSGLETDHLGSVVELANVEDLLVKPVIVVEDVSEDLTPTSEETFNLEDQFAISKPESSEEIQNDDHDHLYVSREASSNHTHGGAFKDKFKIRRHFLPKKRHPKMEERGRSRSLGSYAFYGEKSGPLFGSSLLNREWELVTVSEICRRLSLDNGDLELPIPEGSNASQILDELMIRQIVDILPARATGYPWVSIYNSEKHGFSLATLYRKMADFDEDLSPVLLIIRDTEDHIFGAIVSGAIKPSDHFTGTGDSCKLWRFTGQAPNTRDLRPYEWTGDNQFFVNSHKDYLAIGAGSGHYGLWLDADLNHGRSQRCDTFDNELLAGDKEDFIVQFVEAFGFRM